MQNTYHTVGFVVVVDGGLHHVTGGLIVDGLTQDVGVLHVVGFEDVCTDSLHHVIVGCLVGGFTVLDIVLVENVGSVTGADDRVNGGSTVVASNGSYWSNSM